MISRLAFNNISFEKRRFNISDLERDKTVAILGSGTDCEQNKDFIKMTYEVAYRLASMGYNIVTGGTTGVMEAANKGAHDANPDKSFAIHIRDWEHKHEKRIYNSLGRVAKSAQRTSLFQKIAKYWIIMPGGPGTLSEIGIVGESKYYNYNEKPDLVILVGKKFQSPLFKYFKNMDTFGVAKEPGKSYCLKNTANTIIQAITGRKLNKTA